MNDRLTNDELRADIPSSLAERVIVLDASIPEQLRQQLINVISAERREARAWRKAAIAAGVVVEISEADALLAAAGEGERHQHFVTINGVEYRTTNERLVGEIKDLGSKLSACERERDAYKLESDQYRKLTNFLSESGAAFDRYYTIGDFTWDAAIAVINGQSSEISALKRRLEPLTVDESRMLAGELGGPAVLVKCVADTSDTIRARRA